MYLVKITRELAALRELTRMKQRPCTVYGDEQVTQQLSFPPRTLDQCRVIITAAITDAAADPRTVCMLTRRGSRDG
jgi:hypothetical protein